MKEAIENRVSLWRSPNTSLLAVGGAVLLLTSTAVAQPVYDVTDLGWLPGGTSSSATAINNQGVVVGWGATGTSWQRAFIWENNTLSELPGGDPQLRSWANDVNDAGQVAGVIMPDGANQMATLWENRNPISLGTFGGAQSGALGIDQNGSVVGWAMFSPDPTNRRFRPFRYENNQMTDLGLIPSEPFAGASAISDDGRFVVGDGPVSERTSQLTGPILFDAINGPISLGTLGGRYGYSRAVNNSGQIVGLMDTGVLDRTGYYQYHAFLYDDEKMIDLGVVFGTSSSALSINNSGVIVGTCTDTRTLPWTRRAFVRFNTEMIDLNTLLPHGSKWTITEARDINDNRQIVGTGEINGQQHAVLLTPQ